MSQLRLAFLLWLTVLGAGCSTALYSGPPRRQDQVSHLTAAPGTNLVAVDTRAVHGGRFEVYDILPGMHKVSATVKDSAALPPELRKQNTSLTPVCFEAEASESYAVSVSAEGNRLRHAVIERDSGEDVLTSCEAKPAPEPPAMARTPTPVERPPVYGYPASPQRYARTRDDAGDESDDEEPARRRAQPIAAFRLGLGLAGGGDDLIEATYTNGNTDTLSAGSGVSFTLGASLTPLWIADAIGFGLGGSFGYKVDSIDASNGSIELSRVPIDVWMQSLVRVSPRWFISLAWGPHKDLDIGLSGSGLASDLRATFDCSWGWMAEIGVLNWSSQYVGGGVAFRYTKVQYLYDGVGLNAESFGLELSLHLGS